MLHWRTFEPGCRSAATPPEIRSRAYGGGVMKSNCGRSGGEGNGRRRVPIDLRGLLHMCLQNIRAPRSTSSVNIAAVPNGWISSRHLLESEASSAAECGGTSLLAALGARDPRSLGRHWSCEEPSFMQGLKLRVRAGKGVRGQQATLNFEYCCFSRLCQELRARAMAFSSFR